MREMRGKRFLRYVIIGVSTFALDLFLLWILIEKGEVHYTLATPATFFIAVSLNYALARDLVFFGSKQGVWRGYFYFVKFAALGAAATTFLMWFLVAKTDLHFALVRVVVAGFIGILNYLANLHFNFRVVEKEL